MSTVSRSFHLIPAHNTSEVLPVVVPRKLLIGVQISGWLLGAAASKSACYVQYQNIYTGNANDASQFASLLLCCAAGGANAESVFVPIAGVYVDGIINIADWGIGVGLDGLFNIVLHFRDP